jgi:hypothetical protein
MGLDIAIGTAKGALFLRADERRERFQTGELVCKGWIVTAATRDAGGRTYLGVTHDVYGCVVLASEDLDNWEQLESAPSYAPEDKGNEQHNRVIGATDPMGRYQQGHRYVDQIWKLLAVGDVLYAGVSEAGLFRSDDRGKSWEPLRGFNEHPTRPEWGPGFGGLCAHSVLCDGRDPNRLWVGVSAAGVFRSDDGGVSWAEKNDGVNKGEDFCVHNLAQDPQAPDTIYRQDHRGVYKTDDGGDSWQLIENGLPTSQLADGRECSFGFPIEMDPRSGSVFVVPLESDSFRYPHGGKLRVYRTQNGGASWQALSSGLPTDPVYANVLRGALAVDDRDPCGVYLGTSAGTVHMSLDCGETWSQLPLTLPKILTVEALES